MKNSCINKKKEWTEDINKYFTEKTGMINNHGNMFNNQENAN